MDAARDSLPWRPLRCSASTVRFESPVDCTGYGESFRRSTPEILRNQ
jgi:hypothetical protein